MNENNKIKYLNKQIQKILSIFPKEYYTYLGQISLIYYMLKQYFTKIKREILKKNEYMSNYILSDIRSHGRILIHKYSISRFEEEFRNWLSLDPSNRSRNLLIARVDDTKSGRKYGRKIPELQYLYDYVKKSKYKTHKIFVLMISLGKYDFIIDYVFRKREYQDGYKVALDMLDNFISNLYPELKDEFIKYVRFALDGSYGKYKFINELKNYKHNINFVIKSGGQQKCLLPNGLKLKLKQCEEWMKEHLIFRDFNKIHGFTGSYCEITANLIDKNNNKISVKLLLCRFKNKHNGNCRYILLLTNCFNWHAFRILKTYKGRWGIEVMFRTCKQSLGFKKYSFHSKDDSKSIEMHFGLRFIMYMILNHYRQKHCRPSKTSIDDIIENLQIDLDKMNVIQLQKLFAGKYF